MRLRLACRSWPRAGSSLKDNPNAVIMFAKMFPFELLGAAQPDENETKIKPEVRRRVLHPNNYS